MNHLTIVALLVVVFMACAYAAPGVYDGKGDYGKGGTEIGKKDSKDLGKDYGLTNKGGKGNEPKGKDKHDDGKNGHDGGKIGGKQRVIKKEDGKGDKKW